DDTKITYQLEWHQPNSHLLEITMTIANLPEQSVEVSIPAWRPGRYVIQNYAKNVVDFTAYDEHKNPLFYRKIDKDTWRIEKTTSQNVLVKYDYYARHLDAGSSYLDDSEAYINPITCLMYVPGKELLPVSLAIAKPTDWRVAAALEFDGSKDAYVSDNYHELVDAPILISPSFKHLSFEDKGAKYEIALQGEANYNEETIIEDVRKIVIEQTNIVREVPYKRYLFMYHLLPYRFGHGVEHKNSTSIVVGPVDFDDEKFYNGFLGVTSHEFFHAWNVERIRPEAIYYPDYSKENYTTTMWLYEGVTSYYGGLTLVRTHQVKKAKYLKNWANTIKRFQNTYGRKVTSVDMVSWDSWTKSMGNAPPNSYFSFYTKGNILGLLLDLEIRHRTKNKKSLNDVMQYLYENYARKNLGVPEYGLQKAVEKVADSSFQTFFADYVHSTVEIDYNRYLQYAGLELLTKQDEKAPEVYLGISTSGDDGETKIRNVIPESPAFKAGLDIGDILLAIDGKRAHKNNLDLLLKKYSPGETVRLTVFRRDVLRHFDVELAEARASKYEIKEIADATKLQVAIRKGWLNEEEKKETEKE
ncbi:MAG: M61 family metallopeptidase, partial [bacterium]